MMAWWRGHSQLPAAVRFTLGHGVLLPTTPRGCWGESLTLPAHVPSLTCGTSGIVHPRPGRAHHAQGGHQVKKASGMCMCNRHGPSGRRGSASSAEKGDTREKMEVSFFHLGLSMASSVFALATGTSGSAEGTAERLRNRCLKVSQLLNPVAMERCLWFGA